MEYLFKLRFLSEPLTGRELYLSAGHFSFGRDDCDVWAILKDTAELSVTFDVTEAGVMVQVETPAWLNGSKETLFPSEPLPLGKAIDIYGIQIAIGLLDSNLATVKPAIRYDARANSAPKTNKLFLIVTMMLTSILLLGSAKYIEHDVQPIGMLSMPMNDIKKRVSELKRAGRLEHINLTWDLSNSLKIDGYCQAEKSLEPILALLQDNNINYTLNAICDDKLIKNVYTALQMNGFDKANVTMGKGPGKIIISGQFEESKQWQHVVTLLNSLPGLNSWSIKSVNDNELTTLIEKLRKSNLLPVLSVRRIDERIVISGKLNRSERDALAKIVRDHMAKFPAAQEIVYQNIDTLSDAAGVLPSPVVGISGNSNYPFIILQDGNRLQKGALLPGGYRIENIDTINGIELSRHGELLHLPLGL